MHSHNSDDSWLRPREILESARQRRLAGIAVTDHDTISGGLETRALSTRDILVIVGAEFATEIGDIVGLFLTKEIRSRDPLEVIHQIHEQAGLAFLPHPLRGHPAIPAAVLDAMDGYEALNARSGWFSPETDYPGLTPWSRLLGKASLGGSDAHLQSEIGNAYTLLPGPATEVNVSQQIRQAQTRPFGRTSPELNFYRSQLIKLVKTRDVRMLRRLARKVARRARAALTEPKRS
jgi:predicted metal-dependent phosphoesterase TrpH